MGREVVSFLVVVKFFSCGKWKPSALKTDRTTTITCISREVRYHQEPINQNFFPCSTARNDA